VITLRQLDVSDTAAIPRLYESLTEEECYLRFFTMFPAHLENRARSIAQRRNDQYSLGAFRSGKLLGVANYVGCEQPECAEVAEVVAHAEHLRGVGTALLRRLGAIAKRNGLHDFVAEVLYENHLMLRVLSDAGWPCTRHLEGSVLHMEIDLTGELVTTEVVNHLSAQ
jgi:L-amino acid N-acyltransferase YncA